MSRRTIISIVVIALIAAVIYWFTYQYRVKQTGDLMATLASEDQRVAMEAMRKLKAQGVGLYAQLAKSVAKDAAGPRWRSTVLLGELDDQRAAEPLIKLLNDPEPPVRAAAAGALGQLKAEAAIPHLIAVLSGDTELAVRIAAARALGLLQAEEAVDELKAALKGAGPGIYSIEPKNLWQLQVATAEALGAIGTAKVVSGLTDAVKPKPQSNERVRTAAAYALGDAGVKLQDDEAELTTIVDALSEACSDKVGDVRIAAAHSLGLFTVPEGQQEKVAEALQQAESDPHYWVRKAAEDSRGGP